MSLFATMLLIGYACVKDFTKDNADSQNKSGALTSDEAKNFFIAQAAKSDGGTRASNGGKHSQLESGNITPQWDKARSSENGKLASLTTPVITDIRHRAFRSEFVKGKVRAYSVGVTQELVTFKYKKDNVMAQCLLTLIPDREYYDIHKNNTGNDFTLVNNKGNYSGLVIQSDPNNSNVVYGIYKYKDGKQIYAKPLVGDKDEVSQNIAFLRSDAGALSLVSLVSATRGGMPDEGWFEFFTYDSSENGDFWGWAASLPEGTYISLANSGWEPDNVDCSGEGKYDPGNIDIFGGNGDKGGNDNPDPSAQPPIDDGYDDPPTIPDKSYQVIVKAGPGGTATGGGWYAAGDGVEISATPNAGYKFVNWEEDDIVYEGGNKVIHPYFRDGAYYSFTVAGPCYPVTFTANFQLEVCTVNVNASPSAGGTVTGGGSYQGGSTVTIKAIPNTGYKFDGWLSLIENPATGEYFATFLSVGATYTFTTTGNANCTAYFSPSAQ